MTESTKLLELAERCERASGSARELAATIAKAIGWRPKEGEPGSTTSAPWAWCPDFTASLDVAMQLVPTNFRLTGLAETIVDCAQPWRAILWEKKRSTKKRPYGDGATAALALCAAALRARATLKETE